MALPAPKIQTVVQHEPRRAQLLPPILAALPADTTVVCDPDPSNPRRSPWRTYRACLESLSQPSSHLLVVQDDTLICRDLSDALNQVVERHPEIPVALFVPGVGSNARRLLDACAAEKRYVQLDPLTWVPTVALLWPRNHIESFLSFYDARGYPETRTADDGIVGDWAKAESVKVLATVPSLVEHPDEVPSIVKTAHFAGRNPARIAACWIGEDMSPLELDW